MHAKVKSSLLLLSLITLAPPAHAAPGSDSKGKGALVSMESAKREDFERDVDQVALSAQEQAISKLSTLLKKYVGTRQEPTLLAKLGELQQQHAAIVFRIAHGTAHRSRKALDLTRYNKAQTASIATLTTLLTKYPSHDEIPKAWYMRGRAYEEIKNKKAAASDYLSLVKNHPEAEDVPAAYMSLAEFEIDANNHAKAIAYLDEVEKRPEDPHFPFALYKLAWSHFNLKHIGDALSFAERHVAFYNARRSLASAAGGPDGKEESLAVTSDDALRENTLMDIAVFYFEGYEQKIPKYSLESSLPYLKKIENGAHLGKMLNRFTKLLRAHGHDTDLITWKNQVIASESARPETLDVVITVYEHQLNRRKYDEMVVCAADMVKLYGKHKGYDGFGRAQKLLLDTAESFQAMIVKNVGRAAPASSGAIELSGHSQTLASVYDAFTKVVEESDPRIPRVHYNLAETLFTIKDYDGATANYRWVVDHGSWSSVGRGAAALSDKDDVADASVKSIAARYEVLRQKNLIPKELAARAVAKNDSAGKMEPLLTEWIGWLEKHLEHKTGKEAENFMFEANRAVYAQGHVTEAIKRLQDFARRFAKSEYAIPSATLVIDTWVTTQDWEKAHDLANDFLDVKEWKSTDFSKRLFAIAADSSYKLIEIQFNAHDFGGTVKASDKWLKRYATSERDAGASTARLSEVLSLAGNAALAKADREAAQGYFTRLIAEAPASTSMGGALLARASIHEERYDFGRAAADLRAYLALPAAATRANAEVKPEALRAKVLALTWLTGDAREMHAMLADKSVCVAAMETECEKYGVLGKLASGEPPTADQAEKAFDRARKESGANRGLWATYALEGAKHLSWRDRMVAAKLATAQWDEQDPLVKFTLIPKLSASLPHAFALNRKMMNEIAPLLAREKWIERRVEVIRELENAAAKVMKLPWARIRAGVLSETAALYLDLSRGLAALPPPKDLSTADRTAYEDTIRKLVMPFEEKGQEMRAKAFEIASRFSIEDSAFSAIAEPFFAENPSQAKALKPAVEAAVPVLDVALLDKLDPKGEWDFVMRKPANAAASKDTSLRIKAMWAKAFQSANWPAVAFFMQEASAKALVAPGPLEALKAISMAGAGARGEGLAALSDARRDLAPERGPLVIFTLMQHSIRSCSRDRTRELVLQLPQEELSLAKADATLMASAEAYAGARKPAAVKAEDADKATARSKKK